MSAKTNSLIDEQNRFWYSRGQHIASIWTTPESIHELSNEAFLAGARWNMKQTSELSPHIAKFIEMMILLGFFDQD